MTQVLDTILPLNSLILATEGPLGSQMVDVGCLDIDWVDGNENVLDAILLLDSFILATLSMVGLGP